MGYLIWSSLALLGGAGGLVSTGHANTQFAAIMAVAALLALASACIWRISHPSPKARRD
jgi:hypothetical protein